MGIETPTNDAPVTVEDVNAMAWAIVEKIAAAPVLDGPLGRVTKAREAIAARHRLAALASAPAAQTEWRCFHCGDVFTDERCARLHFGRDEDSDPACIIKAGAEQGLLGALREAEYAAADARHAIADESTDAAKAYYQQTTRHDAALRNAEELGYERGLADGRLLASAPAGDGVEHELTPMLIASARGHLANVKAHGNAEANACIVFEAVLDAAAALARPRAAVGERGLLEQARDAIKDMLREDDGQAWKEARKLLPRLDAALQSQPAKVEE